MKKITQFIFCFMMLISSGLLYGNVQGYVTTVDGTSIAGATVEVWGIGLTTTNNFGYYLLENTPIGNNLEVICYKEGYNTNIAYVTTVANDTSNLDFTLTQPNITANPIFFYETLNPEEYLTTYLNLLNTGSGPGNWNAYILYPSSSSNPVKPTESNAICTGKNKYSDIEADKSGKSPDTLDCPLNTVFCYPPLAPDNAITADATWGYMCYQNFSGVTQEFNSITIWATHTEIPGDEREILVEIYEDGTTPGALVNSVIATAQPVNTGVLLFASHYILTYTIELPLTSLSSGWIGIQATSGGSPTFYWVNTNATPSYPAMQNSSYLGAGLSMSLNYNSPYNWLTLNEYEGTVYPGGGIQNIDVNFDASNTSAGDVYTAEIILTTDPDVGTFNIPVTMTIEGDPLCPVTDLEVDLVNMITSQVNINWMFDFPNCSNNFQYFVVKRNGLAIGSTTNTHFTDYLPAYGTYCYTVMPVLVSGYGIGATNCIEWEIPSYCHNPSELYNEQWLATEENVDLTIENCGLGMLEFTFPDYISGSRFACDMEVALYDTYGDGWNGGSLDVFVNGNIVLDDITIVNGSGPEFFSFPAVDGDEISTVYTPGNWPEENYYEFYDGNGILIYTASNESIPAGVIYGICPQPSFIMDVQPATGQISAGQSMNITITYDAEGFPTGLFDEYLEIWTNDPQHLQDSIFNQMFVYTPGTFFGYVNDCNTGLPLQGVSVSTGYYTATTNDIGYYEMNVDEDTYDVAFNLLGFESQFVIDSFAQAGVMTELSICMSETPYPVSWVWATPDEIGGSCLVEWGLPMGPYEIIYDDGSANEFVIWTNPGNAAAVRFTPAGYPATIIGGRINVGDGSFPEGVNFLGTTMSIGILDDDGINGMPGTILDLVLIEINNYDWVDFYGIFNDTINDGDFYIALWQTGTSNNSAPIAVDTDPPTVYRSYVKLSNNPWNISPYQDFMIRAYVYGPNAGVVGSYVGKNVELPKITEGPFIATSPPNVKDGKVKNGHFKTVLPENSTRALLDYTVALVSDFIPDYGPQTGTLTTIIDTDDNQYNELTWGNYSPGFYAWAIRANYESNQSTWAYSNIVPHLLYNEVTIVVSLCNDGELDSSEVSLFGMDYPYEFFHGITDSAGIVVFDSVIDGIYELHISKVGYDPFPTFPSYGSNSFFITNDTTIGIELIQKMYPPTNLEIDPLTSVATWDPPLITQLYLEDFEDEQFPPDGWQSISLGNGWVRSDHSYCSDWPIPPGDGFYALDNDCGSASSSEDYLITPMVDLRESNDFALYFSSYYTGLWAFSAYIEYSFDNGNTWNLLETISPNSSWADISVDLSSLSGPDSEPLWLAFHGDDNGIWSSGWAVDNVEIKNGPAPVQAYYIFLNNVFEAQTGWNETTYTFSNLVFGEEYEACVLAIYECGSSDPLCTTWESVFLPVPLNLTSEYIYGTDEVPLKWNPPAEESSIPEGLVSFNIYRDSVAIANVVYEGQLAGEWIYYIDTAVPSNYYNYWVSALYELDIFGYPGDIAESAWDGPEEVSVIWGSTIPFFENWDNATFTFNNWTFNENSANWAISSQEGEPAPSAEFTWDPLLENNYSSTLTSYPIIVDYLTEGDLYLSFDLMLHNRNTTGKEHMQVEIFDGNIWNLAADFTNAGSKTEFNNHILNITQFATGNAINVRFNATGQNSFNIISWFVDNINIYRECVAPENLTGTALWNPVLASQICWDAQNIPMPISEWLHWDSGENHNSIGLTDGGTFSAAIKWDESQLIEYENTSITKVRFVPLEGATELILKIWVGDNAESLIYSQDVTNSLTVDEWNEFALDQPIQLNINKELWVGYTITHSEGALPAGADEGPAIVNYGDLISLDGNTWDPISNFGLNYNWNIQIFVDEQSKGAILPEIADKEYSNYNASISLGETKEIPIITPEIKSRHISSFNIYRKDNTQTEYELFDMVDFVNGQTEYCYYDESVIYPFDYYYKVTANYLSETDECESDPARAYEIPEDDFVYIFFEDVEALNDLPEIVMFPNPANNKLTIYSKEAIFKLQIFSISEKIIFQEEPDGLNNVEIVTNQYSQGIYFIKIETRKGATTKKFVIHR